MGNVAIRAENLSKQYRIGGPRVKYKTIRESITSMLTSPLRRLKKSKTENIWALKELSFEVKRGEAVGLIGRNGAGKTTLLKILSRVTEPTIGRAEIYGRVGSLLEVGTGFHPELTGRENIYLNGAILGMKQVEIEGKFDEIVTFSEIEKFLDTPVKHYSSGMYMRLAFSVAAYLEPEILLVDEVLAVGDVSFQRKCLGKMQNVSQQGRTVIFVSHNMQAITRLCERALLLDEGMILQDGPSTEVVSAYMSSGFSTTAKRTWPDQGKAPGDSLVRLRGAYVRTEDNKISEVIDIRKPVKIEIEYDVLDPGKRLSPVIICNNEDGICVFSSVDSFAQSIYNQDINFTGRRKSSCLIPGNFLAEGIFTVTVAVNAVLDGNYPHATEYNAVSFQVVDSMEGDSARGIYGGPVAGVVRPRLEWTTESIKPEAQPEYNSNLAVTE